MKCLERKTGGYSSFEDITSQVKSEYVNSKFEEMMKKLMASAKLKIVDKIYNKIKVD